MLGITMPIYEYQCESCSEQFQRLVRLNDPVPPCPNCDKQEPRKLVSAGSFVLKGRGWYKDHYGLKSSGKKSS